MRYRPTIVYLTSLAAAIVLIITSTVLLRRLAPNSISTNIAGTVASVLGVFLAARNLAVELLLRWEEAAPSEARPVPFPAKWLSFLLLALLTVSAIAFGVLGVVNLALFLDMTEPRPPDPPRYVALSIILPILSTVLLVLLHLKVRAARMLDVQKHYIKELARARNDWDLPDDKLAYLEPDIAHMLQESDRLDLQDLLNSVCRSALLIASSTGLRRTGDLRDMTAVFFGADGPNRKFRPLACAGGTPEYQKTLRKIRPSFLDVAAFSKKYNEFREQIKFSGGKLRYRQDLVRKFRDSVQDCASTAGVVYAIERKLLFNDAYSRCLTTSFDFLNDLPDSQKPSFKFREVIGIPITVFRRKVGVLLLFSARPRSFYASDKAYWIIADIVGSTVHLVAALGYFEKEGLSTLLRSSPKLGTSADTERAIEVINAVRPDFRDPVSGGK